MRLKQSDNATPRAYRLIAHAERGAGSQKDQNTTPDRRELVSRLLDDTASRVGDRDMPGRDFMNNYIMLKIIDRDVGNARQRNQLERSQFAIHALCLQAQ